MMSVITFLVSAICLAVLLVPIHGTVSGHISALKHGEGGHGADKGGKLSIRDADEDRDSKKHMVTSERWQIGDNPESLIWTWGKFNKRDVPLSMGVSFTEPALDDMFVVEPAMDFPRLLSHLTAPQLEPGRVYDMPFPQKVRDTTPFDHMGWFANKEGHAPQGVFDLAHVDVHFFTITVEERKAISGEVSDPKLLDYPPEGYLPADFFLPMIPDTDLPATNDAEQGLHWIDMFAPELQGVMFRQVFIFGSYDGEVDFWEPMITKQFFEDLRTFLTDLQSTEKRILLTFDIKQPTKFRKTSYYPTRYSISYNARDGEFTVSLHNFVQRQGEVD
jgi:hypothetical protein